MVQCDKTPLAKPTMKGLEDLLPLDWMLFENTPLLFCRRFLTVENVGRNCQLANVMEQHSPAKSIQLIVGQAHFLTDELGVCSDSFCVSTSPGLMCSEGCDQRHCLLGCLLGVVTQCQLLGRQLLDVSGSQRDTKSRRGMVGEHHRHVEKRRHGSESVGDGLGAVRGDRRNNDRLHDPEPSTDPPLGSIEDRGDNTNRQPANDDRRNKQEQAYQLGEHGT